MNGEGMARTVATRASVPGLLGAPYLIWS
jgi:hypothetical protein